MSIPYKIDLSRRVKQDLYIKQWDDGIKIHQQIDPVSIPYKNGFSRRIKQELYLKQ